MISPKASDKQLMKIQEVGSVRSPQMDRSTFRYTFNSSKRNGFLAKEYRKPPGKRQG